MLLLKKPNQISAEFAAHAIETPIISPIPAIYWGKINPHTDLAYKGTPL